MTYNKLMDKKWFILLVLFGMFTPQYLSRFEIVQILAHGIRLVSYILMLVLYIVNIKKHIGKTFNVFLLLLLGELLLSTMLSDVATLDNYFVNLRQIVFACFLIELLAIYSPINGLRCLYGYFSACVLINTVTVFLFPNAMFANPRGMWVCWFLGEDNVGYLYYIVASTLAMVYTEYISKRRTVLSCLVWVSGFVFVFHNDIATGKACQIIWIILVLGYRFGWFRKLLKGRYILYVIVGGFIVVVLNRKMILEPLVSILGRNITLSGRTVIWDRVLRWLQERPILGFGVYNGETFNAILSETHSGAHNWMLMMLSYGGIIAAILFVTTVIGSYRDAKACRNSAFYRCVVIGMIVMVIRSLVESGYLLEIMFMMFAMLAYTKEFIQGVESMQVQKKYIFKSMPKYRLVWRYHI